MGFFSRQQRAEPTAQAFVPVDGEQMFVGEQSYQPALIKLLEARGHRRASFDNRPTPISERYRAQLVPERKNPYDPNAVAVHVDGVVVAYLSRGNAARYRAAFGTQVGETDVTVWVKARAQGIVSVWPS